MKQEHIHVAVAVILCDEQETAFPSPKTVLVARRPEHQHQGGLLEFPGGKVEPEETVEQALCRELYEELGIDVQQSPKSPLTRVAHNYSDKSVLLDVWTVEGYRGRATGQEGQEVYRMPVAELDPRDFPEANAEIINRLQSIEQIL